MNISKIQLLQLCNEFLYQTNDYQWLQTEQYLHSLIFSDNVIIVIDILTHEQLEVSVQKLLRQLLNTALDKANSFSISTCKQILEFVLQSLWTNIGFDNKKIWIQMLQKLLASTINSNIDTNTNNIWNMVLNEIDVNIQQVQQSSFIDPIIINQQLVILYSIYKGITVYTSLTDIFKRTMSTLQALYQVYFYRTFKEVTIKYDMLLFENLIYFQYLLQKILKILHKKKSNYIWFVIQLLESMQELFSFQEQFIEFIKFQNVSIYENFDIQLCIKYFIKTLLWTEKAFVNKSHKLTDTTKQLLQFANKKTILELPLLRKFENKNDRLLYSVFKLLTTSAKLNISLSEIVTNLTEFFDFIVKVIIQQEIQENIGQNVDNDNDLFLLLNDLCTQKYSKSLLNNVFVLIQQLLKNNYLYFENILANLLNNIEQCVSTPDQELLFQCNLLAFLSLGELYLKNDQYVVKALVSLTSSLRNHYQNKILTNKLNVFTIYYLLKNNDQKNLNLEEYQSFLLEFCYQQILQEKSELKGFCYNIITHMNDKNQEQNINYNLNQQQLLNLVQNLEQNEDFISIINSQIGSYRQYINNNKEFSQFLIEIIFSIVNKSIYQDSHWNLQYIFKIMDIIIQLLQEQSLNDFFYIGLEQYLLQFMNNFEHLQVLEIDSKFYEILLALIKKHKSSEALIKKLQKQMVTNLLNKDINIETYFELCSFVFQFAYQNTNIQEYNQVVQILAQNLLKEEFSHSYIQYKIILIILLINNKNQYQIQVTQEINALLTQNIYDNNFQIYSQLQQGQNNKQLNSIIKILLISFQQETLQQYIQVFYQCLDYIQNKQIDFGSNLEQKWIRLALINLLHLILNTHLIQNQQFKQIFIEILTLISSLFRFQELKEIYELIQLVKEQKIKIDKKDEEFEQQYKQLYQTIFKQDFEENQEKRQNKPKQFSQSFFNQEIQVEDILFATQNIQDNQNLRKNCIIETLQKLLIIVDDIQIFQNIFKSQPNEFFSSLQPQMNKKDFQNFTLCIKELYYFQLNEKESQTRRRISLI